jgi:adenosylcobinamide amidohydrolase
MHLPGLPSQASAAQRCHSNMNSALDWKASRWISAPTFSAFRHGRFIVAELHTPHRVMTTSSCVGGVSEAIRYLVNHQSCEAAEHDDRFLKITEAGLEGYHHHVCQELSLPPANTAVMGTAANMIYAAHESATYEDLRVDAIVTAGVEGNAATSGDPSQWMETSCGWTKPSYVGGTINTIVVVNRPIRPEAQIRAILTITEGKSAALMELGVSSRYSRDLATGTGTDQICLAAPLIPDAFAYSAANPHSKLGELLGATTRAATKDALRWQNGLEPSLTRSVTHALRRFGFSEPLFLDAMRTRLAERSFRLMEKNKSAVLFEPQAAAAAYAFAAVLDRLRFGVLPPLAARDVLRQQAANLAVSVSAKVQGWYAFWQSLDVDVNCPLDAIYDAVALGWAAKWESKD